MKDVIKNNILGFVIGAFFFSSIIGVIASSIPSNSVTYESNVTVADAIDDLYEKSVEKPSVYWRNTTQYAAGSIPTTSYLSGASVGYNTYVGSTAEKHYACATIQGHEVCLSQPYTQYGIEGHTLNSDFTTSQQTSAKNAIDAVFNAAGITGYSCGASTDSAHCHVGAVYCRVDKRGTVDCYGDDADWDCIVGTSGNAVCVHSGAGR